MKLYAKCCLIMFTLLFLCCASGCHSAKDDSLKLQKIFFENENGFTDAAKVLDEILEDENSNISITTDSHYLSDNRLVVRKVHELYFISVDVSYSEETYEKVYHAVCGLFLSTNMRGIAGNTKQIQFCMESEWGVDLSIIYRTDGKEPITTYPHILTKEKLDENWFVIISSD